MATQCTTRLTLLVGIEVHQNCLNHLFPYVRSLTAKEGFIIGMRRAKSVDTKSLVILVASFRYIQELFWMELGLMVGSSMSPMSGGNYPCENSS
jgi:hypothetical protein